jgi:hypothetical protein
MHPLVVTFDAYVTDVLLRDLVGHDRRPASFLVYLWLTAEHTRTGAPVRISYQKLAESIGLSKSSAQSAVAWLLKRKLLTATRQTATDTPTYAVLKPWKDRGRRAGERA